MPFAWTPKQFLGSDFSAALALWRPSLIGFCFNSNEKAGVKTLASGARGAGSWDTCERSVKYDECRITN